MNTKVKTQKTISTLLGMAVAVLVLFSAGNAQASTPAPKKATLVESEIIAEIDQMLFEDEHELSLLEEIEAEEAPLSVKVFDENDQLVGQGNTEGNKDLRKLVNKAELISELGKTQYYRIVK